MKRDWNCRLAGVILTLENAPLGGEPARHRAPRGPGALLSFSAAPAAWAAPAGVHTACSPGHACTHIPASGVRAGHGGPKGLLLIHRSLWSALILRTVQLAQGSVQNLCLPDCGSDSAVLPLFWLMWRTLTWGWLSPPRLGCFLPEGPCRVFSLLAAILNCTRCGYFSTRSALIGTFDLEMWVLLRLAGGTPFIIIS